MKLEGDSLIPLYQQVIDDIRQEILEGRYTVGQKIPSESELSELYAVSRITIRRAIEELSDAGYLAKKQGKGTYVNPRKLQKKVLQTAPMQSFSYMCEEAGRVPGAKTIEIKRGVPQPYENELLGMPVGDEILAIRRVRTADGIPLSYETVLISADEYGFLEHMDLDDVTLIDIFEQRGMRKPAKGIKTTLEMIRANAELAELLNVNIGEPLFNERGVIVDEDDNPILIGHLRIVASMFSFKL